MQNTCSCGVGGEVQVERARPLFINLPQSVRSGRRGECQINHCDRLLHQAIAPPVGCTVTPLKMACVSFAYINSAWEECGNGVHVCTCVCLDTENAHRI